MYCEFNTNSRIRFHKLLALFMVFLLTAMCIFPVSAAGQQVSPPKREYRYGKLRVLFPSYTELVELKVLHDEASDVLFVNPLDFVGRLSDYICNTDGDVKQCFISVCERQFMFDAGGGFFTMKLGEVECQYHMNTPAVKVDNIIWLPANEFFHFIHAAVCRYPVDHDESEWEPEYDFLMIGNPVWTLPDLLYYIYKFNKGLGWMFTYQDDFGLTDEQVMDKAAKAAVASAVYSHLTLDLSSMLDLYSENVTSAANSIARLGQSIFGGDTVTFASGYAKTKFRMFLDAMTIPSKEELNAKMKSYDSTASFAASALEIGNKIIERLSWASVSDICDTIDKVEQFSAGICKAFVKESAQPAIHSILQTKRAADTGTTTLGLGLDLLRFSMVSASIMDNINNQDQQMMDAISYYLERSSWHNGIDAETRAALDKAFEQVKDQNKHIDQEMTREFFDIAGLDVAAVLGLKFLSGPAFVTSMTNVLYDVLASVNEGIPGADEPEAFEMTMFAMPYEVDALREFAYDYVTFVVGNRYTNQEYIGNSGLLALNYLKSCLVTTEAARKAYASAGVQDNAAYMNTAYNISSISNLLRQLSECLSEIDKDPYKAYGVQFHDKGVEDFTAPDLDIIPMVLFELDVAFSYDPEFGFGGPVTMYLLDSVGALRLTENGEPVPGTFMDVSKYFSYRPGPLEDAGGLNTQLNAWKIPGNKVLIQFDHGVIAAGSNPPRTENYFTLYQLDSRNGISVIMEGQYNQYMDVYGSYVDTTKCTIDEAESTLETLEQKIKELTENLINFVSRKIRIGYGSTRDLLVDYPCITSLDNERAPLLLSIGTDGTSDLPPTFENLVLQKQREQYVKELAEH